MTPARRHSYSLQQKLTLLLAGTATIALVAFATVALIVEAVRSRAALVHDAGTQAELLAVTVASALTFNDPDAATETLRVLRTRPNVNAAWLLEQGSTNLFASFQRLDAAAAPPPARISAGHEFAGDWLFYHEPVLVDGARVGTLILQADPGGIWTRIGDYAGVLAAMLVLMLTLVLVLAARLQRVVSAPVLELAATARQVSERGDYSLRAAKHSDDEIGALVEGFNDMLAEVERGGAALRASEERLSYAMRGATDGLWDWELNTNRVYYSPRWKEMLGYADGELENVFATWERLVHPDDLPPAVQAVKDFLEGSAPKYEVEFRMRHKGGHWVHILARGAAIRDSTGHALRLVGTHVDVTALRASEARLAEAQAIARIGSYDINPQTGVTFWSDEIFRLRQRDPRLGPPTFEEIIASVHPEDRERVRRAMLRSFEEGTAYQEEYRGLLPDGSVCHFLSTAKVFKDERGRVVRFTGTLQDVTERKQAEEALRASQHLIESIMKNAPALISAKDLNGRVIMANAQFDLLEGPGAQAFVGKSVFELFPFEVAIPLWENDQRALATDQPVIAEETVLHKDGCAHTYQTVKFPLRDQADKPSAVCAISVDVTPRKEAEAALRQSEERFRQLAETIEQIFWMVDLATEEVIYVSPGYERIWGRSVAALKTRPQDWIDGVHPEDRPLVQSSFLRQRATGYSDDQYRVVRPDGSVRRVHSRAFPVRDASGHLVRLAGIIDDVTDQHAAKEALEESEKRFRTLAESAPIGIFLSGCDGECRYVNTRWSEITGQTADAAREEGWMQMVHPDDRARIMEEWQAAVQAGRDSRIEYRFQKADGTVRWVAGSATPLRETSGRLTGFVGSVVDVTERHELEREVLEISDREQARLGQEIHDGLCQQLVSTAFTARALEQRLAAENQPEAGTAREVAELIDGAMSQAYDLVGGLFPAQMAGEGVASALQEFVYRVSQRSATRFAVDYPEPIRLDAAQSTHLLRIAQEAITNALRHARPERVRVRLVEDGGMVHLTIEDNGHTGAAAMIKKGGYGLQMMRYRASMLGGTLELRATPGGGTIVSCAFRASPTGSPAAEATTSSHP